ncbi:substrate-binding domain-containing protein [Actinophytocola gossypii]|uniref:PBP domain-containing protein n=1 Tax=Actinophytocola gossypii TaxID=2812003 RepID=A0ABT2J8U3_9PSEU|nr:substrate-binding domain-containing protein [Actinophytocola gossypii]MCT2584280.1 hypothetical protein [Actinophytocola gossypii]
MRSTLRKGAVTIVGASAILSLALGGIAVADPNLNNAGGALPGYLPDSDDVVGTGSDTSQYVINTAAQAQSSTNPAVRLASFNAFQPGSEANGPVTGDDIVIRDADQVAGSGDEVVIPRPNGSSAGINELLNNPNVDFARSSRGADADDPQEVNDLYFIPALSDGLSYVVDDTAGSDIRSLDTAELAAIYRCTDTRGFNPKLPQSGSGTRSFFLEQIGLENNEIGPCVDQNVQEHDASAVDGDPLAIAPFSTARWSSNPPNPANPPSAVVDIAATSPTAGVFYTTRTIYNVVRVNDYDAPGSPLPALFGPDGYLCDRFDSGLFRQGFGGLGADCGVI